MSRLTPQVITLRGSGSLALGLMLVILHAAAPNSTLSAQASRTDPATLRAQLERRFDLLPTRGGLVLRPRTTTSGVRSIEVDGGTVALDGQAVTGAELRSRLPSDADLILQLSYLDDAQRQMLLGPTTSPAPGPGAAPTLPEPQPTTPPPVPAPPATVSPSTDERDSSDRPRRSRRNRDLDRSDSVVRFGGVVNVGEDETIAGDVVVIGGAAHVLGTVHGNVVVVGGSLDVGPKADIDGDAVAIGGALRRDPAARIGGHVQAVGVGPINVNWRGPSFGGAWPFGRAFSLVATLIRVGVVCLLAALVVLFARDYAERVGEKAVAEPLKAGAVGFLSQILFLPVLIVTVILLALTIIGSPLILLTPFAILGLMVLALVGFTAVATHVGRLVTARFGWTDYDGVVVTAIGVVAVAAPVILGRLVGLAGGPFAFLAVGLIGIGLLVEYVAWTIGMGAVALARFGRGYSSGGTVTGPVGPTSAGPLGPPTPDAPGVA